MTHDPIEDPSAAQRDGAVGLLASGLVGTLM